MMRHPSSSHPVALDYLRSSPVRGQLEPADSRTPKGWRYIQTTDTLDELKVLLPPDTAVVYEQLLKFENYELSKKTALSWSRILEIRHLKDRMIRKCQKLGRPTTAPRKKTQSGEIYAFKTLIAPTEFRLKEMEKWFREQQKRALNAGTRNPTAANGVRGLCSGSNRPGAHSHTINEHLTAVSSSKIRCSNTDDPCALHPKPTLHPPKPPHAPIDPVAAATIIPPPVASTFASPKPLPILLRCQRSLLGLELSEEPENISPPPPQTEKLPDDDRSSYPPLNEGGPIPNPIRRRRSCIKRGSIGDIAKTVSWADDHGWDQQLAKYAANAHEAHAAGKWQDVHDLYLQQLSGLEMLHTHITTGLERLRFETERLQKMDEAIRVQRDELHTTFQEFKDKQILFTHKVEEALDQANDSSGNGSKKELLPILEA